ncbi:MAG: acyltransferase [Anaerolineales bacterium]|nr:acyltransferase [Anaerolineales bacterium]
MSKSALYYPELDSLRFFAFLVVLVHHAPYVKSIPLWKNLSLYGWMGVDLFLCLSAFLFARLLFVEYQEKGNINVGYFYLRRALRIWPLYFIFLGVMLIITILFNGWNSVVMQRFIGMLTFTDNLASATMGYNTAILYSAHIWTISYEEQFYLIIPWVLRKFYQIKKSTTGVILVGAMLIGMLIRALFIYLQFDHPVIWVLPVTHFESIFGGLMVGLGLFDKPLKKIPGWLLLLAGIFALYWVTSLPNVNLIQWRLMYTYPLIGIGTSLILFAVMRGNLGFISYLFKNKILGYLGKISYGLYVFHFVGLELARNLTSIYISEGRLLVYPATVLLLSLIITVAISMASYQFLERPFLRLKERFTFIKSRPI